MAKVTTREQAISWQAMMRTAFVEGITDADMRGVVKALVEKARGGDMAAIRMVLSYAVGAPGGAAEDMGSIEAPAPPTRALPATPEKLATFAERAARGQSLFQAGDTARDVG